MWILDGFLERSKTIQKINKTIQTLLRRIMATQEQLDQEVQTINDRIEAERLEVRGVFEELKAEIETLKANPAVPNISLEGLQAIAAKVDAIYEPTEG